MEADALTALSRRTAALVAERSPHVVRVDARHRGPASGVVWSSDGLVVTTHHALERDEELEVGLPSGESAAAELVGRDPDDGPRAAARLRDRPRRAVLVGRGPGRRRARARALAARAGARAPRSALVARAAGEYRGAGGGRLDRYLETSLDLAPGPLRLARAWARPARRSGSPPPGSSAAR